MTDEYSELAADYAKSLEPAPIDQPTQQDAAAADNPYMALAAPSEQANAFPSEKDIRQSLISAAGQNADQVAKAVKTATQFGDPTDVARYMPEEYSKARSVDELVTRLENTPVTKEWLSNRENAAVGHDDTRALTDLEMQFGTIGNLTSPEATWGNIFGSLKTTAETSLGTSLNYLAKRGNELGVALGVSQNDRSQSFAGELSALQTQDALNTPQPDMGTTGGRFMSKSQNVLQSLVQMAEGIPLGPAYFYGLAGGQQYATTRARGGSNAQANAAGDISGVAEAGFELLPMKFLTDRFGSAGFGEFISGLIAREVPSEVATTIVQQASDALIANPDMSFSQYAEQLPANIRDTVLQTVAQALVLGGAGGIVNHAMAQQTKNAAPVVDHPGNAAAVQRAVELLNPENAQLRAQATADGFKSMLDTATTSKLRERDPSAFADVVQKQAESNKTPDVYVDAEAFAQAMQTADPDKARAILAKMPSIAGQLAEAQLTGGDLRIPTGEFTAAVAGTPMQDALLQHIRAAPDKMSVAQAEELKKTDFSSLRAQVEQIAGDQTTLSEHQASADAVYENVLAQLAGTNRFTAEVSRNYATLTREFYSTLAKRLGVTPEEAFAKHPLRIHSTIDSSAGLDQAPADDFNRRIDTDFDKLLEAYNADHESQGGKIISADIAKRLSEHYLADPTRAPEVHEPSSRFAKELFARRVTEQKPGRVYFSAGGVAAGKSSQLSIPAMKTAIDNAHTVYDATMSDAAGSAARIRQSLAAGHNVLVVFTYRHPLDAVRGALGRAVTEGRTVPIDYLIDTHKNAFATQLKLRDEFADEPRVQFFAIDNSGKEGEAKLAELDTLTPPTDIKGLKEQANAILEAEHQAGRISDAVYTSSLGRSESLPQVGRGSGAGGSGQPEPERPGGQSQARRDGQQDQLDQAARGKYQPTTNTIALLKDADLSTYLHELGHHFLTTYANVASQPGADPEIARDVKALLKWFGVKDLATWNAMSLEQQREAHEKFARGFEAYLFGGEAPNPELHSLFRRFADWLMAVYKNVKALNVSLTSEVRGVMDRMIASREQIAQAETLRNYRPLFESADAAGMTPDEFTAYQRLGADATSAAEETLEKRSLRDMKWMADAKSAALRAVQKDTRSKRAAVEAEVTEEVRRQQVYAVRRFLSHGELPEADRNKKQRRALDETALTGAKLSIPALKEMYGEDAWPNYFANGGKHAMAALQGTHPQIVADAFGYASADDMIHDIVQAEPEASVIEGMTDQRMLERYGDIQSPDAQERAAEAAIHNEARGRFVAAELKALENANNVKGDAGVDKNGRKVSVNLIIKAAKQFAADVVSGKKIRDLRPGQIAAAESKAARAAQVALAEGDLARAAAAKRQEMVAHHTTIETLKAQTEIEKALNYFRKLQKQSSRENIDPEYIAQIDALLERYDLRKNTTIRALAKRQSLLEWVEAQRELGFEPPIDPALLREAAKTSYKDMTVRELRGLRDSVKVIEHLGRLKNKLLTAKDQREFDAIKTTIVDSIHDNSDGRHVDPTTVNTTPAEIRRSMKNFFWEHMKVATLARILDGGKDGGPVWEYLIRGMNNAGNKETSDRAAAAEHVSKILSPILSWRGLRDTPIHFAGVGRSLNREARIAVALNVGNEGNLQRLLDGGVGDSGPISSAAVQPILDTLTREEWDVVQKLWDHFESYRSEIGAKEKRVNGVEPEWIEATPVQTRFGVLRGGYYPIVYDPAASIRAEEHADADAARQAMQAAYTSATTRRSFTKSRADAVNGRPLLLSLAAVYRGTNEVIHDLSWHEWLIDANRILKNAEIDRAIRLSYGPEFRAQFKTLLEDIARGDAGASSTAEKWIGILRRNITSAAMAFNVLNALQQPLGYTQTVTRIGPKYAARGLAKSLASPVSTYREILRRSDFMRDRAKTRLRELNEVRNQVKGQTKAARWYDGASYALMLRMQQLVDIPTWWGAFEKAMAASNDEQRAAELADQAVIDAQGSGMVKDQAHLERRSKLLTTFYGFFSTTLNNTVAQTMTQDNKAKLAADYLLLLAAPAVLGQMLYAGLTPSGGDDDWKDWTKHAIGAQVSFLLSLFVGARELQAAASAFTGGGSSTYGGPTAFRVFGDAAKAAVQIDQGEADDSLRRALLSVAGDLLRIPSNQLNKTITGLEALEAGKTTNLLALVSGYRQ